MTKTSRRPGWIVKPRSRPKEPDLLEVVNPLVLQHEFEQSREMGHRDEDEVQGETGQGVGHELDHLAIEQPSQAR